MPLQEVAQLMSHGVEKYTERLRSLSRE
jgi:hypothetical protein